MIGDKRLDMPKTLGDARQVFYDFGLEWNANNIYLFQNAKRLVELNNEVYNHKLNKIKVELEPLYCGNDDD